MELVHTILLCPGSADDAVAVCDQLELGTWAVEAGFNMAARHDPRSVPAWRSVSAGVALSICSATALRLTLGPALCHWLARYGCVAEPLAGLALHELVVNAAVHGNLGVSSKYLELWEDLCSREAAIEASLQDASRRDRLVTVALGWSAKTVIAIIADEGDGYDAAQPSPMFTGSGRGLRIARDVGDVQVLQGGRQTVLSLPRPMGEANV